MCLSPRSIIRTGLNAEQVKTISYIGGVGYTIHKCTKDQFIHLLTVTFKDLHIENSKNYKR